MRKYGRLGSTSEFETIYKNAKKWHCEVASVYFLPADEMKFAPIASKKIGNAVVRNKVKRRLRAIFASFCDKSKKGHYIMIAKDTLPNAKYEKALKNIRWALSKIGVLDAKI